MACSLQNLVGGWQWHALFKMGLGVGNGTLSSKCGWGWQWHALFKMWLGVGNGMLSSKYVCLNESALKATKPYEANSTAIKLRLIWPISVIRKIAAIKALVSLLFSLKFKVIKFS